jgi:hypothetical protein
MFSVDSSGQKEKPTVSFLLAVGVCMPDLNLV